MDANAIESQTVGRGLGALANRSVLWGLFFISMATLIYEVLLTRVFSVRMWITLRLSPCPSHCSG